MFGLIRLRAEGSQCNCLIFDFSVQEPPINVGLFNLQLKEPNFYSNDLVNLCELFSLFLRNAFVLTLP